MFEWEKAMNVCFQERMFIPLFTYGSLGFCPYTVIAFSCHSYAHGDAGQMMKLAFRFFESRTPCCEQIQIVSGLEARTGKSLTHILERDMYILIEAILYSNVEMMSGWVIFRMLFDRGQQPVERNLYIIWTFFFFFGELQLLYFSTISETK